MLAHVSDQDRDPLLNTVLGGYMLRECLGAGGSARVYRGESTTQKRIVRAIKVIHWEQTRKLGRRFIEEARLLEELAHPNIVKFHHATEDQGYLVMVLEMLRGKTLRAHIETWRGEGQPSPLAEVLDILIQASEGVAFAHAFRKGVVHRDIKPENLFVMTDGTTKVLDFGIARALDDAEREAATTTGVNPMGTAPYMAPELWHGEELPSPATDVYSLGITLFEALTCRHPFEDPEKPKKNAPAMMNAHLTKTIRPLREVRPDAPEELEKIVEKATAKESANRYGSAAEFGQALRDVRKELVVSEKPPAPAPEPEPEPVEAVVEHQPDPSTLAITEKTVEVRKTKVSPAETKPANEAKPERSWRKAVVGGFVAASVVSGIVLQKLPKDEPVRAVTNAPSASGVTPAPSVSVVQAVASSTAADASCPGGMQRREKYCIDELPVDAVSYSFCNSCPNWEPARPDCPKGAYELFNITNMRFQEDHRCISQTAASSYCASIGKVPLSEGAFVIPSYASVRDGGHGWTGRLPQRLYCMKYLPP